MKGNFCSKKCADRKIAHLPEEELRRIEARLRQKTKENRISCADVRALAEELGVYPRELGALTDKLDIRINQCQLGCF